MSGATTVDRERAEAGRATGVGPPEWIVHDGTIRCPYLPARMARLPLRLPARPLTRDELSRRLAEGDRRQGIFLYRTTCAACQACEPIRIDVGGFRPNRTQRRVLRRGDATLEIEVGRPAVTSERVALYNRHKAGRGLQIGYDVVDAEAYAQFLVETCVDSIELRYRLAGKLVAIAIADRGADALSAVYCCYDPDLPALSLGNYSILKEVELCRHWGLPYLYLGFYVAGSGPMTYKARYLPHQRLIDGEWQRFARQRA